MAGLYDELIEVVEKLRKATHSDTAQTQIMEAIVAISQVGKNLGGKKARKVFTELIPEIARSTRSSKARRFAMDALQKAFETKVAGKMEFDDELQWFLKSKSRLMVEIRRLLTGLDIEDVRHLLNVTKDRLIHVHNLSRRAEFPKIYDAFEKLIKEKKEIRDGIRAALIPHADAIKRLKKTGYLSAEDMWKVKGAITEILSLPIKQAYLKEIKKKFPKAILIENVMAKTQSTRKGLESASNTPRQIWDGIIAEVTDSGLIIHAKFEIKSGMQGFKEGFDQILDTFYNRFISKGDELHVVLPNGVKRVFVNSPGAIKDVTKTNILITPEGVSSALPDQIIEHGEVTIEFLLLRLHDMVVHHSDIEAMVMDFLMKYE